jgi:hypothetical protein
MCKGVKNKKNKNKDGLYIQEYMEYKNEVINKWVKRRIQYYNYLKTLNIDIHITKVCDDKDWDVQLTKILKKYDIVIKSKYCHKKKTDNYNIEEYEEIIKYSKKFFKDINIFY